MRSSIFPTAPQVPSDRPVPARLSYPQVLADPADRPDPSYPLVPLVPLVPVVLVCQQGPLVPVYHSVLMDRVHLVVLEVLVDQEALGYHFVQEDLGKIFELMQNLSLR